MYIKEAILLFLLNQLKVTNNNYGSQINLQEL